MKTIWIFLIKDQQKQHISNFGLLNSEQLKSVSFWIKMVDVKYIYIYIYT